MIAVSQAKKQFVLQHGQSDCGPACLASIIRYHGGERPLDELRRLTGTTKTGTKLLGLYQGAKELGFDAEGMEAERVENLKELNDPAILHVILENKLQHYVVFYGFEGTHLIIGDPAKGVEKWEPQALEKVWQTKSLLTLKPNTSFVKGASNSKKYANLIQWVKEDFNILLASLFLGVLIAIFSLATAIFSQKLIDVILPTKEIVKLTVGMVLFSLVLLARTGLGYVRSTFLITQSKDFNNRMIDSFFKSLLQLPKPFFDSKKTGEMIARMNDTRRIQTVVSSLVGNLLIEVLVIIVSLIGVFAYSWQIGVIVSLFLPVYVFILWRLNSPIIQSQKQVMTSYALNEGNYIDVITGISEVKSTGKINLFHQSTTNIYRYFQDQLFGLGKLQVKFNISTELASTFLMISVISFAAFLVLEGQLLLGAMMAILTLTGSVGPSLSKIALFNVQLQEARVAFDRMAEFTNLEEEEIAGIEISKIESLELKNLYFNFPGSLPLLKDLSIKLAKGSITTLLGESGSGKSTILQLLQRFYKPTSGEILINDKNIEGLDLVSLRKKIGVVPQDIKIFNNYLLFNIALSEKEEDLAGVVSWSEQNGFDQFFKKFPQGYMTLLGEEGANLSGGQKQLVGLARALYRNPDVLLIDEGTSAMDKSMEQFILDLIQTRKQSKAILMITHRTKVAAQSDYIYHLEQGVIGKEGKPLEEKEFFID
ncbi:MAG: peptidase domain-containing ABC transporter [Cyclobacteriaceae bacterium]|uniref:peptidase domain-containing ABC transporter n=1 Tax=Fulvivirga sp. TaxID=1931237 RepID=UPI0032F04311